MLSLNFQMDTLIVFPIKRNRIDEKMLKSLILKSNYTQVFHSSLVPTPPEFIMVSIATMSTNTDNGRDVNLGFITFPIHSSPLFIGFLPFY